MDNNRTNKDNLRAADIVNRSDLVIDMSSDNHKKPSPKKGNIANLDIIRTTDEAKRRGRNGGIKSGETRRARKTLKENILSMMVQEISPDKLQAMGVDLETLNGDYTLQNAVIASLFRQAIDGDTKAAQLLRDTIDEAPTNRQEIRQEVITADDLQTIDNLKRYLTS